MTLRQGQAPVVEKLLRRTCPGAYPPSVRQTEEREQAIERPARTQRDRSARVRRLALAAIWLAVGIGTLATGERLAGGGPGAIEPGYVDGIIGDWAVAGWVSLLALVGAICLLVQLVMSPQPWRATRWGWFWPMMAVPPLGITAYLLLSGPTPGIREPRDLTHRMSGLVGLAVAIGLGLVEGLVISTWF